MNRSQNYTDTTPNMADYSFVVPTDAAGTRLDRFLSDQLPELSRTRIQHWIEQGAVLVDDVLRLSKYRVHVGDLINATALPTADSLAFTAEPMELAVVYEDRDCLVINKPAGLVTHPAPGNWSGTLLNGLLALRPELAKLPRAGIVHRLDKFTSGLTVIARTEAALTSFSDQLSARTMSRRYLALVHGRLDPFGTIHQPIGRHPTQRLKMAVTSNGKVATTHWRVLAEFQGVSLIECKLETGRTHQIRVHMQNLGHPLLGDPLYGAPSADQRLREWLGSSEKINPARQMLHAWSLSFQSPGAQPKGNARSGLVKNQMKPASDFLNLCHELELGDAYAHALAWEPIAWKP